MRRRKRGMPEWTEVRTSRRYDDEEWEQPTSPIEAMRQWNEMLYGPMAENMTRMWSSFLEPWQAMMAAGRPSREHHKHKRYECDECGRYPCGCGKGYPCKRDDCACRCCIVEADLVVYARNGERRVVPFVVENPRRREREVRLELSGWTTRGGSDAPVTSGFLGPTQFTVPPCGEQATSLGVQVNVGGVDQPGGPDQPTQRFPDVDECTVFYADLRVVGCDIRPVRIALAVLPRDCSPYQIDCGCACC